MAFRKLLLIGAALLALDARAADLVPAAKKKLDAYFGGLQQQGLASGSIAISERGVMRYQRSLGFSTIENGVPQPADAGTRYRIGPVSRLFTAALAYQLAEQATLTLDNKLAEFFPDEPDATRVSYREMLQGRSRFDPDTSYLLLGRVLEKVRERPYAEIVKLRISDKLGLVRTYYAGSGGSTTLESVAYEWAADGWRPVSAASPPIEGGAFGMISNAGDLVVFMDALFAGKVVSPYSLGSMRGDDGAPPVALESARLAGTAAFGIRGSFRGFDAAVYHFPERRITVAWTSNASRVPLDQLLDEVTRVVFKRAR